MVTSFCYAGFGHVIDCPCNNNPFTPVSGCTNSESTINGATLWVVAVALEFVAFLLGGVNFVTTAMNSRAPGMRMFDVPIVVSLGVIVALIGGALLLSLFAPSPARPTPRPADDGSCG